MKKFINPLDNVETPSTVSESSGKDSNLESKSAMVMDDASVCPKCKKPMESAIIESNEEAYWCTNGCRVSSPKPLEE